MKHSKLPWYVDETHISNDDDIICDHISKLEDREFIVQCCNSHDELVEILKNIMEQLMWGRPGDATMVRAGKILQKHLKKPKKNAQNNVQKLLLPHV